MANCKVIAVTNQKGGVGKTTTIGKLAAYFGEQGKKVLLGAADTFRAAAADQHITVVVDGSRHRFR